MTSERFDELVAALLDGSISEDERAALLEAVMEDPKRGKALVDLLRLEPLLKDAHTQNANSAGFAGRMKTALRSGGDSRTLAKNVITKLHQGEKPIRGRWPAFAAAAILLMATLGFAFRGYFSRSDVIAQLNLSEDGKVFLLSDGGERQITTAAGLKFGQGVRCESGSANIQFPDGSKLTVEAGGVISRVTDGHAGISGIAVKLATGNLSADVAHQPANSAFQIITASAVVRVIGTRFSVASDDKATQLKVLEGTVELKRSADGAKIAVHQGFTAVAAPEIELAAVPIPPGDSHPGDQTAPATAITYFGGPGTDSVTGTVIQNDGTVIFAANFSGNQWGGKTPLILQGADAFSKGVLVRLSPTGRSLESVSRVTSAVHDLDVDAEGALYIASEVGVIKVNSSATRTEWQCKTESPCIRLASARDGAVVALTPNGKHKIQVITADGKLATGFSPPFSASDVAVDGERKLIFICGSRSGNVNKGEIGGVACLSAFDFSGKEVWQDYGFDPASKFEWASHTSGERVCFGRDGFLYGAFLSVGGNHIFTRDPKSLDLKVDLHGNGAFDQPYATGNTHITFVGRFDPKTGTLLAGQQLLGRDKDKKGTAVSPKDGDIAADEDGRVYLVGQAQQGGPATRDSVGKPVYSNHEGFICIFAPGLHQREFYSTFNTTEVGGSNLRAVSARRFGVGKRATFSAGGELRPNAGGAKTVDAIQPNRAGMEEGLIVVRGGSAP